MVSLGVILPAYNEAQVIGSSIERLSRHLEEQSGLPERWNGWEIVVVDDGSADGTATAALKAARDDRRVRVLRLAANTGKGSAIRAGVEAASSDYLVATDVDLSYALEDITEAFVALRAGADMVTGDRHHSGSRIEMAPAARAHAIKRQAVSGAFNLAVRVFFGMTWRDTQCGLKGFTREAAGRIMPRLLTRRFLADIEMFLIAARHGLRIVRIPVHLTHLSTDSTVNVIREASGVAADALRIKWAQLRRRYDRPVISSAAAPP